MTGTGMIVVCWVLIIICIIAIVRNFLTGAYTTTNIICNIVLTLIGVCILCPIVPVILCYIIIFIAVIVIGLLIGKALN